MSHLSENCRRLNIQEVAVKTLADLRQEIITSSDVALLRLPAHVEKMPLSNLDDLAKMVDSSIRRSATLIIVGEVVDLIHIHAALAS